MAGGLHGGRAVAQGCRWCRPMRGCYGEGGDVLRPAPNGRPRATLLHLTRMRQAQRQPQPNCQLCGHQHAPQHLAIKPGCHTCCAPGAGEPNPDLIAKVPKEYAPDGLQPGMMVRLQNGMQVSRRAAVEKTAGKGHLWAVESDACRHRGVPPCFAGTSGPGAGDLTGQLVFFHANCAFSRALAAQHLSAWYTLRAPR